LNSQFLNQSKWSQRNSGILFIEKGVTESFPFDNETLVLKVGTKVFLLMGLERQPLGINVKTDPEWSAELREQHPQITGAYHMNKTHWNSVVVDGLRKDLILK
jgi:predicted DNA-binding protein (MmcQ/YjbR family)